MRAALLILSLLLAGPALAATQLTSCDFETDWCSLGHGPTGGDSDGTSLSSTQAHGGTQSAKVDYNSGNNLNHIWYDGFQSSIDRDLYISFWGFHTVGFLSQHNFKWMRLTNNTSTFNTNNEFLSDMPGIFGNPTTFHWQPFSACGNVDNSWSSPAVSGAAGTWHHWEFYGKLNTKDNADGIIRVWFDDVLVKEDTSWVWIASAALGGTGSCDPASTTYKWNTAYFPSNLADACTSEGNCIYYMDDLEVWDGMPTASPPDPPPPPGPAPSGIIFQDDFETGEPDPADGAWDYNGVPSQYVVTTTGAIAGTYSLRTQHVNGGGGQNSVEQGFGDNTEPTHSGGGARVNHLFIEVDVKFDDVTWPTGSSTKILNIESWPDENWPSTSQKDFQAILELIATTGELVVSIKREDTDFPYTYYTGVTFSVDTVYNLRMEVGLDEPYTLANGTIKLWVDDVLEIDVENGDFILTSRGADLPHGLNMLLVTGFVGSGSDVAKDQWWDNVVLSGSVPSVPLKVFVGVN